MGYGSYSAKDWQKLKASKNLSSDKDVKEVFKSSSCNPKFNPLYIGTRECFDSEEHPNTTPIVVGFDVTGSMGYLAVEIGTKALNDLILKLYSTGVVEDPALMCAAYGDLYDGTPLQVTQFESDIRIAEQLLELYYENGGYGEVVPTLLWEFLARHTNIDAVKKRGEKGFLFTIGDTAVIRNNDVPKCLEHYLGDKDSSATRESLLEEVSKTFNVFHIEIGNQRESDFMAGRVMLISPSDIVYIPQIIISVIQLQKGKDLNEVLKQWDDISIPTISRAIKQLTIIDNNKPLSL